MSGSAEADGGATVIRPETIREAAAQAVLYAIKEGRRTEIWIDNNPDRPKYVVRYSEENKPLASYKRYEFVAYVEPKTPPGRVSIETAEPQATFS